MATQYHIYANDGNGGPVDYTTAVATVDGLTYSPAALGAPSDNTFAVRASDTDSGLEETNTDVRVRIVIDGAGADISGLPNPPVHLAAHAAAGGAASVDWAYSPAGQGGRPTGFHVWLAAGGTVDYESPPAATVSYTGSILGPWLFTAGLAGLTDGTLYTVGVRAYNGSGTEANTDTVQVTGKSSGPAEVDNLSIN